MNQPVNDAETVTEYRPIGKYRVRVIHGKGGQRLVDVREYISSHIKGQEFEGYTRRGIRLSREEAEQLIEGLKSCVANIKSGS